MSTFDLWVIVLSCGAATFLWRFLGVIFSRRIDPGGAVFEWITCVSYGMVAGLVFRLLFMPENDLASVPIFYRLVATLIGFAAYYLCRRMLIAGIVFGSASLSFFVYAG
jgi:branched-subunit amino acid transport protein